MSQCQFSILFYQKFCNFRQNTGLCKCTILHILQTFSSVELFLMFSWLKIHLKRKIWRCEGHWHKYNVTASTSNKNRNLRGALTNKNLLGYECWMSNELFRRKAIHCSIQSWYLMTTPYTFEMQINLVKILFLVFDSLNK